MGAWFLRVAEGIAYGLVMGSILYAEAWVVAWSVDIEKPPTWALVMACAVCRAMYVRSESAARQHAGEGEK